jgi:hypothetical protein
MAKTTPQERAAAERQAQQKKAAAATTAAKNKVTQASHPGEIRIATPNGFIPVSQWDFGYGPGVMNDPALAAPGIVAQPQPPDPYLALQTLQANQNVQLGDADAAYQQGQLGRSSGFDAAGNLIQQGSAAFSPYSQAMLLQDQFKRNQAGTANSYAAQGQYNSGAYGRAKERDSRLYGQDYDALKTSAQQGYHGINQGRLSTYANNALGTGQASFQSLYKNVYPGS